MRILALDIKAIHKAIDETYGTSRIADGILCNHKRVTESSFSTLKGEHTKRKTARHSIKHEDSSTNTLTSTSKNDAILP